MKLTDTHSHLYDTAFDADREEALARAAAAGVEHLLLPGIDSESHGALFDLCRRHPGQCVPMMGLHPTSVNDNPHWREELAARSGFSPSDSIVSAEPIRPKALFDILIVAPCTGNTLARLAHGLTDTPATMAVKSHLRGERPVVLAVSTNV